MPSGDFTMTLEASDLGLSTAIMQEVVTQVQEESAQDGGLSNVLKREMAEYPFDSASVDTSGWADFNGATLSMTSDGTGGAGARLLVRRRGFQRRGGGLERSGSGWRRTSSPR